MRIELRPASAGQIGTVATRMREADRIECAAWGMSPRRALRSALASSVEASVAWIDGRAEAMMGVAPINAIEGVGRPWMLATDRAFDCARAMLLLGPHIVEQMHGRFPRLENMVSANNERAIRMLGRWGFRVGEVPVLFGGVPFLAFAKEI